MHDITWSENPTYRDWKESHDRTWKDDSYNEKERERQKIDANVGSESSRRIKLSKNYLGNDPYSMKGKKERKERNTKKEAPYRGKGDLMPN